MRKDTVPGWQLPYLRVELIWRRLQRQENAGGRRQLLTREKVHLEQIRATVRQAGWFN